MAGSSGNKAISAFNLVEVEVEAELGKNAPARTNIWTTILKNEQNGLY